MSHLDFSIFKNDLNCFYLLISRDEKPINMDILIYFNPNKSQ